MNLKQEGTGETRGEDESGEGCQHSKASASAGTAGIGRVSPERRAERARVGVSSSTHLGSNRVNVDTKNGSGG